MKKPLKLWAFLFIITWILYCRYMRSVAGQCLANQKSLLLELRSSLEFNHSTSTKLSGWNLSTDCCQWHGIDCNSNGAVIGLDVSEEAISSRIDNLSSLFRLKYLQRLNLAYNPFLGSIPSALGNLSSLTYLNVSHTGFMGEVPVEISQLVSLVILDLSMTKYGEYPFGVSSLSINNSNLAVIFRNLTQLRELYLGGIDFSAAGNTWGEALSSLPRLQALSMAYCNLKGGLVKVRSLSVIDLEHNSLLSTPIPEFLVSFTNLTTLRLFNCSLTGTVPQKVFEIPTLETLELGYNLNLQGTLPSSIGNLKKLTFLDLLDCNFQGIIPPSIGSLNQLEYLDLSFNNFSGPIPSFSSAKNLKYISLPYNSLTGSIPESMFPVDSKLQLLDFGSNQLEGPIPTSLYQLRDLTALSLSFNKFDGVIKLNELLTSLQNLLELDLSYNRLSVDTTGINASTYFPQLYYLSLASTNLHILPEFLKDLSYFFWLDLSNNQINGRIPSWIWIDGLVLLNLSCNNFIGMEPPPSQYPANFEVLDLHSNNLQGQLPALPSRTAVEYLDFSNNSFATPINPDFINGISSALFISLAQNRIYGSIPTSLCNVTGLEVLDLSYNDLNGTIPGCLIVKTQNLAVLNLRGNVIQGAIPDIFPENCTLETLNLNMNFLVGRIPGSLAYCRGLKVMDLGNNRLNDTFPCHFESLSSLQVLILRSNQLHGTVVCPKTSPFLPLLQIIDIAANHFSGQLSTLFLDKWAMAETNGTQSNPSFLQYHANNSAYAYYKDEVSVTFKNYEFQLRKILTIFTSIDVSSNAFRGGFPKELGNLNALKVLNLSHNSLSGNIPGSIGNLSELESLDLSYNALGGSIPQQLASLSFLGYLNQPFNKLEGLIPTSTQLQSFDASSYEGNLRLYGPPLTPASGKNKPITSKRSYRSSKREMEWMLSGVAVGFPAGITVFFGPLVCIKRWREWYNYQMDRRLMKVLPSEESQKQNRRRKASRKQTRRN